MTRKSAYQQLIEKQNFSCRDELFNYLRTNKEMLYLAKKSEIKYADGVFCAHSDFDVVKSVAEKSVNKAAIIPVAQGKGDMPESFPLSVIINTTNYQDSHNDVHIDGIWKKSQKETKLLYLLQVHDMEFESIIADSVKDSLIANINNYTWKQLGYKYEGSTQALQFDCVVNSLRNPYMADQYWKGYVYNHSVGMWYVNYQLAMNSEAEYDVEQKKVWDKYYPVIANKEVTDERGYFWAVLEARFCEGSAVPLGSNFATPTISVGAGSEAGNKSTSVEPPQGTHKNALSSLLG